MPAAWPTLVARVIRPLFHFLDERVGDQGSVLFVLDRYGHRVEWFDRDEIHHRYGAAVDNGHLGEDVYDRDLQRVLFLDGGNITQAKARPRPARPTSSADSTPTIPHLRGQALRRGPPQEGLAGCNLRIVVGIVGRRDEH